MDDPKYWTLRISKRLIKRLFIATLLLFFLYFLAASTDCSYSDRTRNSTMLSLASGVKVQISDFLLAHPGKPVQMDAMALLPEDLDQSSQEGERMQMAFREITATGEIRMYSPQTGTLLILTPTVSGNQVKWTCWGRPLKKVPANCRLPQAAPTPSPAKPAPAKPCPPSGKAVE